MAQREPLVEDLLQQVDALQAQHAADTEKIANLKIALETSRQIGEAIGILMSTQGVAEDEGFQLLLTASNSTGRKLRDIAGDVVETRRLVAGLPSRLPDQRTRRP